MTERAILFGSALMLILLASLVMAGMHDRHYRNRRWQLLEGRVASLERIIVGDHD